MNAPGVDSYSKPLVGTTLLSLEKRNYSWFFRFSNDVLLATESSWRFLNSERIVVTSEDHEHQFGLAAPVDAAASVLAGVAQAPVADATITHRTGDLVVDFGNGARLQYLQMSGGYESWRLYTFGTETICTGGGEITSLRTDANQ